MATIVFVVSRLDAASTPLVNVPVTVELGASMAFVSQSATTDPITGQANVVVRKDALQTTAGDGLIRITMNDAGSTGLNESIFILLDAVDP